ncbi:hypothetical protein SOASR014_13990 [Pectobacterium carotovorum subsp. carotovorum]|nr:hypothetical protein SOASR014_13990 [Pectobacterium carotovorum subsp. carotovorum]GLX44465.1 hypothetical protein Pcaca01_21330 [Pectobacterium carotovorum subsp. carotovorum]
MTLVQFQLALKKLKKGEGIRRAACETGDDAVMVEATHFTHVAFHHGIAQSGLSITANDHPAVAAYAYNCCHELVPV